MDKSWPVMDKIDVPLRDPTKEKPPVTRGFSQSGRPDSNRRPSPWQKKGYFQLRCLSGSLIISAGRHPYFFVTERHRDPRGFTYVVDQMWTSPRDA
jgi:hypothetical protein